MAEYRDHYEEIRRAGASVAAIAVDPPGRSEAVRRELGLPFPILCDTQRRVVEDWDVFNPREKGGIARPAVFLLHSDRTVRFCSVDKEMARVPVAEIVRLLRSGATARPAEIQRKAYWPGLRDWFRALRNMLRLGVRSPKDRETKAGRSPD